MHDRTSSPQLVAAAEVRRLLSDPGRLTLVAQPIVDLRNGVITGYEALARFELEQPASPDLVFAAANGCGLGDALEALVVERALGLAVQLPPNCFLSINVDPDHLTASRVFDVIVAHGPLDRVVFELTEQRRATDIDQVARCLAKLRQHGAYVAVDDAGAGYSGLLQILKLRPQFVKHDRALVSAVHADEAKRAMVQMVGEVAARLDAWVIAEGIEDEQELRALAQLSVPLGQGNFLALPAPPWSSLSADIERVLDLLPNDPLKSGLVGQLVEPCTPCAGESSWPEGAQTCVRLDANGRPTALRIVDSAGERVRAAHDLLRVKRTTTLAAVALRGAARSERLRWDPIVCIDDLGRFDGVVHMHKLVWALASCASGGEEAAAIDLAALDRPVAAGER